MLVTARQIKRQMKSNLWWLFFSFIIPARECRKCTIYSNRVLISCHKSISPDVLSNELHLVHIQLFKNELLNNLKWFFSSLMLSLLENVANSCILHQRCYKNNESCCKSISPDVLSDELQLTQIQLFQNELLKNIKWHFPSSMSSPLENVENALYTPTGYW